MPFFDCEIKAAGIEDNGRVQVQLKAKDGSFDWRWFLAKKEQNREALAIALAAITASKNVRCQLQNTTQLSEFDILIIEK
jgi:hypothetical protein